MAIPSEPADLHLRFVGRFPTATTTALESLVRATDARLDHTSGAPHRLVIVRGQRRGHEHAGLFLPRRRAGWMWLSDEGADDLGWTAAHELGHVLVCAARGWPLASTPGEIVVGEYIAQRLAAELLDETWCRLPRSGWRDIDSDDLAERAEHLKRRCAAATDARRPVAGLAHRVACDYAYAAGIADATGDEQAAADAGWLVRHNPIGPVVSTGDALRSAPDWRPRIPDIVSNVGADVTSRLDEFAATPAAV